MATDGKTPPAIDKEIYARGESVVIVSGSSNAIEAWVGLLRLLTQERLDWFYAMGYGNVLFLGTPEGRTKVIDAVMKLSSIGRVEICTILKRD
jgi:hypothetical protein